MNCTGQPLGGVVKSLRMNFSDFLVLIGVRGTTNKHICKRERSLGLQGRTAEMGGPKEKANVAFVEPSSDEAFSRPNAKKHRSRSNIKYHSNCFWEITEWTFDQGR